jgi:hypothetical protein
MQKLTKEYLLLFNAITQAQQTLLALRDDLITVQQQAEEYYLEPSEPPREL